jgi:hypothetical protein
MAAHCTYANALHKPLCECQGATVWARLYWECSEEMHRSINDHGLLATGASGENFVRFEVAFPFLFAAARAIVHHLVDKW